MLAMLTIALMVLTAGVAMQAREAYVVGKYRRGGFWSAIGLTFLFLTVSAIWFLIQEPKLLWWVPPTGFGVDWHCQDNVPPSVRVCFKR